MKRTPPRGTIVVIEGDRFESGILAGDPLRPYTVVPPTVHRMVANLERRLRAEDARLLQEMTR